EQLCADDMLPAADMVDLLTALADKSLVEVEPEELGQARYRLLETVREYGAERLALAGETAIMDRRRRDYSVRETERSVAIGMAMIPARWSERVESFRRFDVEAANLSEVLGSCLADGDAETGLRICTAMRPVWIVRGTVADGGAWMEEFLAVPAVVAGAVSGRALAGRARLVLGSGSWRGEGVAARGRTR